MRIALMVFFVFTSPFSTVFAQLDFAGRTSTIISQVTDEQGQLLPLGNVLLRQVADSSLQSGSVFYDGTISLPEIAPGTYLLQVTALGFVDHWQTVDVPPGNPKITLEAIRLAPAMLQEIEVMAFRKVYEQTSNGLVVNVAQTMLANSGSAADLLRSTPKVIGDRNGGFSLLGKGAAVIYLDGQRLASTALLANLSAQDIKKIELLDNPPARYEAEGNAVINIITNGSGQEGYKLAVLQELGQGKYFRSNTRATLYYKTGKIFAQGTAGLQALTWGNRYGQQRRYPDDFRIESFYQQKIRRRPKDYELKLGYDVNNQHRLQLQYTANRTHLLNRGLNSRVATEQGVPVFTIDAIVNGPTVQKNNTYNLLSTTTLDTLGSQLQLAVQHTDYYFDRQETIGQEVDQGLRSINRRSENANNIEVWSGQLDYEKHFTPQFRLAGGLKAARISNTSGVKLLEVAPNGVTEALPEFSNDYNYRERILAAYLEANWVSQRWTFSGGIRTEQTTSFGENGQETLFDRNYLDVFPSASLSRQLGEQRSATLSYSYRINRPVFQDLNPYILYVDSLVSLRGNPNLLPEYAHNFTANLQHQQWNLDLSYVYTPGKINQLFRSPDPGRPEVIAFVKENFLYTKLYSATVSRAVSTKHWSAYISLGVFYDDHKVNDLEQALTNTKTGVYFRVAPTISLPGGIQFNGVLNYTSPRVDGVYDDNAVSFVNLSLTKQFFDDRLSATLWANDIFKDYRFTGVTSFNGTQADYLSAWDMHFVKVMLNWQIGRLGPRAWRTKRGSGAEQRRIQQN